MKSNKSRVRKRRKQLFVERFGGKCVICGYDKCLNSLHFHHVNGDKEYRAVELMNFSIEKAEKELEKCILVCANCHGEIHSENYFFDYLPTRPINWKKVECEFCHKKFKTKRNDQKFCTKRCSELSQRRVKNRPEKEELEKLIKEFSWVDLGRLFGVSDNAVRKWARKYNLEL